MLLSWDRLKKLSSSKIIKSSIFVLVAVPVLGRVSELSGDYQAVVPALGHFLDGEVMRLPVNLLRVFWSSVLVTTAQILFRIFSPRTVRLYSGYPDWKINDDAAHSCRSVLAKEIGDTDESALEKSLQEKYEHIFEEKNSSKPILRHLIALLYATALYLLARVILVQLSAAWAVTDFRSVFLG